MAASIIRKLCLTSALLLIFAVRFTAINAQNADAGSVCVVAYEDANHTGGRESGDALLSNVSVDLMVSDSVIIANHVTDGKEPYCFANLAAQQYTISFSSPLYDATTPTSYTFDLAAGERVTKEFGAARLPATEAATAAPSLGGLPATPPMRIGLSVAGAALSMILVAGIGFIIFGLFVHRR